MGKDSALIVLYAARYKERKISFLSIPEKYRAAVYERLDELDKKRADEELKG